MEEYWLINPSILINKWYEIFPKKNMSRNQFVNSLIRFSILIFIVFLAFRSDFMIFTIPLIILILAIYISGEDTKNEDPNCKDSTLTNPYMNKMLFDKDHRKLCKNNKNKIEDNYNFDLYKNSYDLFNQYSLKRQFYTMPVTSTISDNKKFGNWLYNSSSCKYDNERCLIYEDERFH
tara:strand:+ start:804 stop:1334 length:531 start_codon:yes stop_codon:yes gene_type:complete